jgi:hypothetical protein
VCTKFDIYQFYNDPKIVLNFIDISDSLTMHVFNLCMIYFIFDEDYYVSDEDYYVSDEDYSIKVSCALNLISTSN